MASRMVQLNALKQGIVRLRTKGGADPSTLYDLLNGYVTIDGSIQSRPGTVKEIDLPAGTKGMCAFGGKLHVFSTTPMDSGNPKYVVHALHHPNANFSGQIKEIHFASAFMGALYVVAEFTDDNVYHYWLRTPDAWKAGATYDIGDLVSPSVDNGWMYEASADNPPPAWDPGMSVKVGDEVQPTTYNGWKYKAVQVDGDGTTGDTEPEWPTSDGAQVIETVDQTPASSPTPTPPNNPGGGRYGNPGGSYPRDGTQIR